MAYNPLPFYQRYPRDFIEGTIGMAFEIKGAYSILLDLIYLHLGSLPDDPRYISGQLNVSVRKWKSIRKQLIELDKIQINGDCLQNYRAVIEVQKVVKHCGKKRENRSRPNKNNDLQSRPDTEAEADKIDDDSASAYSDFQEVLRAAKIDTSKDISGRWFGSIQIGNVEAWKKDLGLSQPEIIEVVKQVSNAKRDGPPSSLKYFTPAMQKFAGQKNQPKLQSIETGGRYDQNRIGNSDRDQSIILAAAAGSSGKDWG